MVALTRTCLSLLIAGAFWVTAPATCWGGGGRTVPELLPRPTHVTIQTGTARLGPHWQIALADLDELTTTARVQLLAELRALDERSDRRASPSAPTIVFERIPRESFESDEAYELVVQPLRVRLRAESSIGLFYAAQTLRQLLRGSDRGEVPCLEIRDTPALSWRGISDDVARGQMSTMDGFRHLIERMGYYKLNRYFLYLEDSFVFECDPAIGRGRARLTAAELRELTRFGHRHGVEVIPIVQALGHNERLLELPRWRRHAELQPRHAAWIWRLSDVASAMAAVPPLPGGEGAASRLLCRVLSHALRAFTSSRLAEAPAPWSVSPTSPSAEAAMKGLLAEILEASPGRYAHLGGDEAADVGQGQSADEVSRIGSGRVQARYLQRMTEFVADHRRESLIYADPLRLHPEAASELDKRTILVDWQYDPTGSFQSADSLAELGFRRLVLSAGMWNWRTFYPDYGRAVPNIVRTARAAKHGQRLGAIVSSWGDWGAESLREANWPGYAMLAAWAWESGERPAQELLNDFAATWWGPEGAGMGDVLGMVGWQDFTDRGWGTRVFYRPIDIRARTPAWLARMKTLQGTSNRAEVLLARVSSRRDFKPDDLFDCVKYGQERFFFLADREIALSELAQTQLASTNGPGRATREVVGSLGARAGKLERDFRHLWLRMNRPEGLEGPSKRLREHAAAFDELSN